ncbi:hypothetical protein G6F66_014256 [Rhizopus arrhizus]|nr:hypothetical protein G6F66_014256 [Rhizopus arrhizus]
MGHHFQQERGSACAAIARVLLGKVGIRGKPHAVRDLGQWRAGRECTAMEKWQRRWQCRLRERGQQRHQVVGGRRDVHRDCTFFMRESSASAAGICPGAGASCHSATP